MESLSSAQGKVLGSVAPLAPARLPLAVAGGRYLAETVYARRSVPTATCSAMDGYAVRAAEAQSGARLLVERTIYAGDSAGAALSAGEAVRIFTGAPLPPGADAVVRQEIAIREDRWLRVRSPVASGQDVRPEGEDLAAGAAALPAGTRLGPRQLGLCHAAGVDVVLVGGQPRVTLIATGEEIFSGRVPDSNGTTLAASIRAIGGQVFARVLGDGLEDLGRAIDDAIQVSDAVITMGGVSVGERDHVPAALAEMGAEVLLHGVAMKPGKPFLFARANNRPIFALPGSPSACMAAYEAFVRPALLRMSGADRCSRRTLHLPLAEPLAGRPGRARLVWARVTEDGRVRPIGRDVAQVRGPALADVLVVLPSDRGPLAPGDLVECWLLEEFAP